MESKKQKLIEDLRMKWDNLHWPGLPPFSSDLRKPASDLVLQDTFVAGCISRIIKDGELDEKLRHVLTVDQDLTNRIAATDDPKTEELLQYKNQFDECIRLARLILQQDES